MEEFASLLRKAVQEFRNISNCRIKVVSHLDSDGISAAAIMTQALENENIAYSLTILHQLDVENIKEIRDCDEKVIVFTDLGSGQLRMIEKELTGKKVFVLDHHMPETEIDDGIVHVNPHLSGIDGGKEVSGAGVVYLFVKELNPKNTELAHIAVIGAIGDVQEENGFVGLNKEILSDAVESGKLIVEKGAMLFGAQTKPLYKIIEYSSALPDIRNESEAVQFLSDLGIELRGGTRFRKIHELTTDEKERLNAALLVRNPEIMGNIYTLADEKQGTSFRDAKEFSTLLNSCGRLGYASYGVGALLGDEKAKRNALKVLDEYKREIVRAMHWFEDNDCVSDDGYVLINAKDNVQHTVIGTLASILAKSGKFKDGTLILALARTEDMMTKVSLRVCAVRPDMDVDLREVLRTIVAKVGGEAGGHKYAAGALLPVYKEEDFVKVAREELEKRDCSD